MRKFIFLPAGILISVLFSLFSSSCSSETEIPKPVRDTIYIRDTIRETDTVCTKDCFGAVACYPFEGNADDISGNGFHGTLSSGATLTTGHKGDANSAYYFNKTSTSKIELPNLSNFDKSGEISISFWSKTDNVTGYGTTILSTTPDVASDRFQININWSGNPVNTAIFDYGNISSGRLTSSATTPVFDNWEHYVFVKSTTGNFMKIYRNGSLLASKSGGSSISNKGKKVLVGGIPANGEHGDQFFKGSLDDLKIFSKALTETEVKEIFDAEK